MTFQMWSPLHYLFIASPFIFTLVSYIIFKRGHKKHIRIAGIVFSSIGILLLIARNLSIFGANHVITPEIIPLQVCHLANFILLFAFLFESKILFAMAFCFSLPAAFLSIVFANSLTNYSTILTWQGIAYIFGHMLIVGISLWAFSNNMIKIKLKVFLKMLGIVTGIFILSIPVNNLFMKWMTGFKSNYFYTFVPEDGTPLQSMFNMGHNITFGWLTVNPIYVALLMASGIAVILFFYGIYFGLNRLKIRLGSDEVISHTLLLEEA